MILLKIISILQQPKLCAGAEYGVCQSSHGLKHSFKKHHCYMILLKIISILQQPKLCAGAEYGVCQSSHGLKQVATIDGDNHHDEHQ